MTGPATGAAAATAVTAAVAVVRAPFTGRARPARRDVAFCLLSLPLSLPVPVACFAVTIGLANLAARPGWPVATRPG